MRNEMDKYKLMHKVGSGAFGVTFGACSKKTGEKFAMKCIPRGETIDKYVEGEIKNHSVLHHPNVIQFKEVVLDDYKLGIVMEYAEEGQLLDLVKFNGPFSEAKAREMFQMLIAGVSYIHSQHIYHRDLKLENILLTNDHKLKICDFGLSKSHSLPDSIAKSVVGTPLYRAPEVLTGTYEMKRADVWSCGLCLYVMLTKDRQEMSYETLVSRCLNLRVSDECKNLLLCMIEKIPDKRIKIEDIQKDPWYLKNLPKELKEEAQPGLRNNTNACQSEDDINKIIEKAKTAPKPPETEVEEKTSASFQGGKDELEDNEQMTNGTKNETSSKKRKDILKDMAETSSTSQERKDGVEDNKAKRIRLQSDMN